MRFTLISERGEGLGIATHLSSEGHSVLMLTQNGTFIGKGIVERGKEIKEVGDVIIYDSTVYGKQADEVRKQGIRVLGASQWGSLIANDASYKDEIIKAVGWDSSKVSNGIQFYITVWFNGANYISSYSSIVYHRLMSGGKGPDVNGTGFIASFAPTTARVYKEILKPLQPVLRRVNHRGCFHVRAMVTGDVFSIKDINTGFGPLSLMLLENSKLSTSEILLRLFNETSEPVKPLEDWAVGLLVTLPPYPYSVESEPVSLRGLEDPALRHVWFIDAMKEGDVWSSAGESGKLGYVTARGSNKSYTDKTKNRERMVPGYQEALSRAYRTISRWEVRDLQYRDDIGRNLEGLFRSLREYGWLN